MKRTTSTGFFRLELTAEKSHKQLREIMRELNEWRGGMKGGDALIGEQVTSATMELRDALLRVSDAMEHLSTCKRLARTRERVREAARA